MQQFGQQILACIVAVLVVLVARRAFSMRKTAAEKVLGDTQKLQIQGPNGSVATVQLQVEGMNGLIEFVKMRANEHELDALVADRLLKIESAMKMTQEDIKVQGQRMVSQADASHRRGVWNLRKTYFLRLVNALGQCLDGLVLIEPFVDGASGATAMTDQEKGHFFKAAENLHLATGRLNSMRWDLRFVLGTEIADIVESLPVNSLSNHVRPCRATIGDYSAALFRIEALGRDVLGLSFDNPEGQTRQTGPQGPERKH